jgi:hypothetical protein
LARRQAEAKRKENSEEVEEFFDSLDDNVRDE